MNIRQNISLRPFNTFGIDVPAAYFTELGDERLLPEIAALGMKNYVLGGGSNILLTAPVEGLVIRNVLKGMEVVKEDADYVWLKVAGGEVWHDLVMYAVNNGWGGIENLALIPGTVGAAPIQNIGAYGVEVQETIEDVTFWYWKEGLSLSYNARDCHFGYRDSIFKNELKDKVFITSVTFRLSRKPVFNTTYGAIEQELAEMGVQEPTVKAIAYAVMHIRRSKLPDPALIGNAGSFFKNPTISVGAFAQLLTKFPRIPSYIVDEKRVKVPAGWLIEQCGWKGFRENDTGVHARQALVLVNYGNASGDEIWKLSERIVKSVKERFDITLEQEVQTW